ncbi:flagellar hook protein FlgE [Aquincola sp. S2]|uniref:Flagellar hook protein FlgE n=1 Tax=Pseudaquabacterium terrae TaxID=2732868 RepID=A0ABX2EP62_9BURK|nr:flagellar hook protein FlgE [Aquabacterium terrae]NRF70330.1 flagellar hook protein FlgE [Aquabacterium terrae]
MAFQQGLSGLNATSKNLSVIGNNIANANTYGAKASRAEFADMYANAMNGSGGNAIGIGVNLAAVTQRFTQGNITTTESGLDIAINGNGFFQLDSGGTTVYSRNGQFQLDKDGNLVNGTGAKLLGYAANTDGAIIPSTVQALRLPTAGVAPASTTEVGLELNLDSRVGGPAVALPFDPADPTSYNNATSVTVYDAKGQEMALTFYFRKEDTVADPTLVDTWDVYMTANGQPMPAAGGPIIDNMQFATDGGSMLSPAAPVPITVDAGVPLTAGGASLQIDFDLDVGQATQYGAAFSVTDLTQDGYAPGQLTGVSIDKTGIIKAQYSNGQSKAAGQLVLATFRNPQGLQPMGGNAWSASFGSGDPIIGAAGQGNFGLLQSGALEESNVDLTAELVNMITAQRAYQANAQSIKTEDQVLQTLVNLR